MPQYALQLMRHIFGLTPILEPEVDINAPDKSGGEDLLKTGLLNGLGALGDQKGALKVTIPTVDGFSSDLVGHPSVGPSRRPVRRPQPGRGERASGPESRTHRELRPGTAGGAHRPARPTRSSTARWKYRSARSTGHRSPDRDDGVARRWQAPCGDADDHGVRPARRRIVLERSTTGLSIIGPSICTAASPAVSITATIPAAQVICSSVGRKAARVGASCAGWMHSLPPGRRPAGPGTSRTERPSPPGR